MVRRKSGLLNSDIDLENKVIHLERGVKEVWRREGLAAEPGRDVKVGKLKTATSKRSVPLNEAAIRAIFTYIHMVGFRSAHFLPGQRRLVGYLPARPHSRHNRFPVRQRSLLFEQPPGPHSKYHRSIPPQRR